MDYSVKAVLSATDRNFTSTMKAAEKAMENLHKSANNVTKTATNVGKSVERIGSTATRALTIPLTTAFGYAGKQFMDFETGLIGVKKTTGMVGQELKGFGNEISKMSTQIPISSKELLGLSEVAGQLGIHGQKDLLAFTRVMAEMGSATNLAGEEGAASMAKFANIMGLDVGKNIRNVGDAIVRLGNNYATTENDIMMMSTRLAASGRLVGLTTPNVLGLATAMSSVGINAEAGGSAMSQVLNKIDKAVAEGGEKLEMFASVSGMSAQQFSKQWKSDPIVAVEAFMKGLDDSAKSGENMNLILDSLGIKGIREANTVKSLSQNHELLSRAIRDSSNAYANGNDLATEAAEAWDTLRNKLVLFKNAMNDVLKDVFARIEPVLSASLEAVTNFVAKWQDLTEVQKNALADIILKVAAFAAAFGPAMKIGGKFIKSIEPISGALSKTGSAFSKFATSILGDTVRNMGLACTIAGGKMQLLPKIVQGGVKVANLALKALFPASIIGTVLVGLGALYTGFEGEINKVLEVAKTKGPEIIQTLGEGLVSKIPEFASKGAELVSRLAETISANIPTILTVGANIVIALVESVGNNAGQLIGAAVQIVGSLLQGIVQNLPRLLVAGAQLIGQIVVGIIQNIPTIMQAAVNIISGLIAGLGQSIPQLLGAGVKIIFELVKGIIQAIPQIILVGVEIVATLVRSILGALGNIAGSLISGVKGFFKNIFSPGKEEASNTKNDVTTEMSGLSNTLDDILSNFGPKFQQTANQAKIGFTSEISMMSQETQTKLQEMSNATGMSMDEIVRIVQEKGELTKGNLTIKASEMNNNVSGQTDEMANNMIDSISRGVDGANSQFDGLKTKLPSDATATNEATSGQYEDLANRITSSTEQANSAVTSGIDTINANFEMRLGTLPAKTDTILNNVSKSFINAFNALGKGVDSNLQKIISAYSSTMSRMNSISNSGLNNLSSRFTSSFNRISATVTSGTNKVVVSISNMNNRVNASFSQFSSRFISTNSNMWNRFNSQSTSAMNKNYSAFSSNISKLQSKFTSYSSRLTSLNNSMWNSVVSKSRQAGDSMTSGFSSACNKMTSLANSMRSRLISIMNSSVGGMRSAGYNAGMGFYSGLASTRGSIMGLASSIAASVSSRIRSALNIHSPSRVMMDLGSYAGEGLAVGLDKSRKYVNKAVDGLSDTVASTKVGFGSSFSDLGVTSKAQPLVLNVRVGKNEFRAISRDITSEQGRDLRLEENFAI